MNGGGLPVSKAFNPGLKVPTPSFHRIGIFLSYYGLTDSDMEYMVV